MAMPSETTKERARTYLELIDAGRFDELSPILSPAVVYRTIGRPPIVGASNLIAFYKATRTAGVGVHEVLDMLAEHGKVAVLLRMKANLPDGRTSEFGAVDVFTFAADGIVEIRTFIDLPPAPSELTALRK